MELLLLPQWFVVVATTIVIIISSFYSFYPSKYGKKQKVPLHAGGELTQSKMANKYGPIFTVQLHAVRC